MSKKNVTITDVAAKAGVSVPTVSKVLNLHSGVSDSTRSVVEEVVLALGYVKRETVKPNSGIIDILIADLDSQWALTLIQGANEEAQRLGFDAIITTNIHKREVEEQWLKRIGERGTDGVVLVVSKPTERMMEMLHKRELPVVLLDPVGTNDTTWPVVSATNWAGGLEATEYLLAQGHKRIGIITGPQTELCHMDRLDGYSAALRRAGIEIDMELVREGDSMREGGLSNGKALLSLKHRPTAIFSCSDEQATGIYEAAAELGLRVPEDLSVIGFDDVSIAQWLTPRLTTIRQPLKDMGATAVRRVVALQDSTRDSIVDSISDAARNATRNVTGNTTGESIMPRVELATSLVVRDSVAVLQ